MQETERTPASPRWFGFAATAYVWFDVFLYSSTVLLLAPHFFAVAGHVSVTATALASITVSVLFRPVGAIAGGWLADRVGRRPVTLLTMAAAGATALIAVLPTVEQIGGWATGLLLAVRALQGLATGALWPGLSLLVVEAAPEGRRGVAGAVSQAGVPGGLMLSSGAVALTTAVVSADQLALWGWRLPYLVALCAVVVAWHGWRTGRPAESPVVRELRRRQLECPRPLRHALAHDAGRLAGVGLLVGAGQGAALVLVGAFVPSFVWDAGAQEGTGAAGLVGAAANLGQSDSLLSVTFGSAVWLASAVLTGALADRVGATPVLLVGGVYTALAIYPFLVLISRPSLLSVYAGMLLLGLGMGAINGARALWVAQRFRAQVRGVSVGIATGCGMFVAGVLIPPLSGELRGEGADALRIAVVLGLGLLVGTLALWALRGAEEPIEAGVACPACAVRGGARPAATSGSWRPRPSPSGHSG